VPPSIITAAKVIVAGVSQAPIASRSNAIVIAAANRGMHR
jgi:hypothetical protein